MIKNYQEDLTLAAPLYSETDELWPLSPSDPNWYYGGSEEFEWVSGKGVGDCTTGDLLLRPLHSACTPIDCTCNCLLQHSIDFFSLDFVSSIYFDFYGLTFLFSISQIENPGEVYARATLQNNGVVDVVSSWVLLTNGVVIFRILEDGDYYRAFINGSNVASISKTEDNHPRQEERENTASAFWLSIQNTSSDQKFYLKSVDFEYDEFVSNPFWTDLINCHETT
jgi:hypothetical protein